MSEKAVYLFAVCRAGISRAEMGGGMQAPNTVEADAGKPGAGDESERLGEPVIIECTDRLCAVASTVDKAAWTGEEAADNMQSLAWIAPRATRHEEVVEAVMEAGPAYPARFGTLFSSTARLKAVVTEHEATVCEHLDRVDGAQEWAVKLLLDRDRAVQEASGEATPMSGTAYLQQKVREREAQHEIDAWLDEVTDAVFDTLASLARSSAVVEARDRPDDPREVAAHGAFLVPEEDTDAFFQAVDAAHGRLSKNGVDVECTGPWPTYSFRPSLDDMQAG